MSTRRFYVDPSVIAGLILGDLDQRDLFSIINDATLLTYSDFGLGEVVSAISARVRARHRTDEFAATKIVETRRYLERWHYEPIVSTDVIRATALVGRPSLSLKLPDAIHIATAERIKLPLLTHDRQQHAAARLLGYPAQSTLQSR